MDILSVAARHDLAWLNEPEEWSFTGETGIAITAPPDTDFFCDPAAVNIKHSAPFLYKAFQGDFQITARVNVEMLSLYDAGCVMLRRDAENWAKLCFEFNGTSASIVSVVTKDGSSDDCNHEVIEGREISLRITKVGKVTSLFFSQDATHWKLARYFGFETPQQFQLGIVAQSPVGAGTQVRFSSLDLSEPPPENRFS